ncbi:peptidyl-prolyl cis-trans isomerase FKBP53-like, partial [Trifolium medium]|nr:peptidyl-prolyl cis-trans isomerase FKBP53-like [Trifolium medium]
TFTKISNENQEKAGQISQLPDVNSGDNNPLDHSAARPLHVEVCPKGMVIEYLFYGKVEEGSDDPGAALGNKITIMCSCKLKDGTVYEEFVEAPYGFILGKDGVKGWEVGIKGMRVGDKRRLTIPPSMGYGEGGNPNKKVPPDSWLIHDIELIAYSGMSEADENVK